MAHINNFTDMINALPKQEMEVTEDLESPVSPPTSTPTSEEIRTTKGEFGESNVHDQSGISFRTPAYPDPDITEPVKVSICLRQPSKNVQSEPQDFWYTPNSSKIEARNASLDNDLKQKILMIQRIAEEAKLTDLDIKKEEKMSSKPPSSIGSFTPPPRMAHYLLLYAEILHKEAI